MNSIGMRWTARAVLPYVVALFAIVGCYALLHTKYRIFYVDDAWCLSYVYNYAVHGVELDTLVRPPGHPRSVLYFSKLSSILTAPVLDVLGWTKGNAHLVSSFFLFCAAGAWFSILRALRFTFEVAAVAALGMLLFPAFFSSANLTRPDTLALLGASLALLAFVKERYLLAGFFCVAATEVHIMGCTSGFYVLSYTLYRRSTFLASPRRLAAQVTWFVAGVVLGCGYYYALHHRNFELVTAFRAITQHSSMRFPVKNPIAAYFFGMDWLQKLPELVFTLFMVVLFFWRLRRRAHPFVRTFLIVTLASTLVLTRPNGNYMIYIQPALVLAFVHSFELLGKLERYATLVFGYFLLHYGVIWWLHREFDHDRVTRAIRAGLVRTDLPVIGMMDNWFAAMDRPFFPIYPSARAISERAFDEAYLIRNDYVRNRVGNYDATLKYMQAHFELTRLDVVPAHGAHSAELFFARRKQKPCIAR